MLTCGSLTCLPSLLQYPFPNHFFFFFQQPTKVSILIKESGECPLPSCRGKTDFKQTRKMLHFLERNSSSCSMSTKGFQNTLWCRGNTADKVIGKDLLCCLGAAPGLILKLLITLLLRQTASCREQKAHLNTDDNYEPMAMKFQPELSLLTNRFVSAKEGFYICCAMVQETIS